MNITQEESVVCHSMTYSKVMRAIADKFGVNAVRHPGLQLVNVVLNQVSSVVREECRRAVEESAFRIFRLAVENLPANREDGLYIPSSDIRINTANLGLIRLRSFRMDCWDSSPRLSA